MTELNVFPAEDTLIKCNLPDGKSIEFDAIELQNLSNSLFASSEEEIPYNTYIDKMRDVFESKYGYKMGISSMMQLIDIKDTILSKLKKSMPT